MGSGTGSGPGSGLGSRIRDGVRGRVGTVIKGKVKDQGRGQGQGWGRVRVKDHGRAEPSHAMTSASRISVPSASPLVVTEKDKWL